MSRFRPQGAATQVWYRLRRGDLSPNGACVIVLAIHLPGAMNAGSCDVPQLVGLSRPAVCANIRLQQLDRCAAILPTAAQVCPCRYMTHSFHCLSQTVGLRAPAREVEP